MVLRLLFLEEAIFCCMEGLLLFSKKGSGTDSCFQDSSESSVYVNTSTDGGLPCNIKVYYVTLKSDFLQ